MSKKLNFRRQRALARLNEQLSAGTKNTNDGPQPLTADDRTRIHAERRILERRINGHA
jgi:hypothetical protein